MGPLFSRPSLSLVVSSSSSTLHFLPLCPSEAGYVLCCLAIGGGLVLLPGIWIDKLKSLETDSSELGRNCSSLFLIVSLTDSRRDRGHGATMYTANTLSASVAISAETFPASIFGQADIRRLVLSRGYTLQPDASISSLDVGCSLPI
ncbi:hypothetical protein V8C44DRAFT_35158 [Trichoderma aethiopicum]